MELFFCKEGDRLISDKGNVFIYVDEDKNDYFPHRLRREKDGKIFFCFDDGTGLKDENMSLQYEDIIGTFSKNYMHIKIDNLKYKK